MVSPYWNVISSITKEGTIKQYIGRLDILFPSNHNIHKSLHGLFWGASDPLIERFYKNLSIKGPEAQKQSLHQLLLML